MGKTILITGGAGFIGSNFISYLLEETDYHITNIDCLTYAGNLNNLNKYLSSNRYQFLKCDISKEEELARVFHRNYDVIVNFAAESHVDRSIEQSLPFIHSNIIGTYNLIQAVMSGKAKKMIQISTDEVYGSLDETMPPFNEHTSLSPNNPYSASKASADLLVRSFYQTYKCPLIISRCCNNYGPHQHPEKFIPKIITKALNDEPIPLYGDGSNIRDWIFVKDHCRAIYAILENGRIGEVYNIGGNEEKTNKEVIQLILKELGKSQDLIECVEDRKGHDFRYAMDPSKMMKELGWKPQVTFIEGIKRTIEWYKTNVQ